MTSTRPPVSAAVAGSWTGAGSVPSRCATSVAGGAGEEGGAGRVAGFARVGPYSGGEVYRGVGEHGVYVAAEARGHGLGRALLAALEQAAEDAGLHKLTARIFATNAASLAAHRAAGF